MSIHSYPATPDNMKNSSSGKLRLARIKETVQLHSLVNLILVNLKFCSQDVKILNLESVLVALVVSYM